MFVARESKIVIHEKARENTRSTIVRLNTPKNGHNHNEKFDRR